MNRSKTAAEIYKEKYLTKSAGIYNNFQEPNLDWADLVIVMEEQQRKEIAEKYPKQYLKKKILCLNIQDIYQYMQKELVEEIKNKIKKEKI